MNADSGFLYQLLTPSPSTPKSNTATETRLFGALNRLVATGFSVDTDGDRLKVSPAALLNATQRDWIHEHKPALVAAVSATIWRWCVEYPDGARYVVDYLPEADWRRVSAEYRGAAVWPAPEGLDVAELIARVPVGSTASIPAQGPVRR